jgi:mannosyltransferase OCH1-like enzyme
MIFQYWDSSPPGEVAELMATWETAAKEGFEYRSFDDSAALAFIRDRFGDRVAQAYLCCGVPAMKADLFRYCALATSPGIYADADTGRVAPVMPLYKRLRRGLLMQRRNNVANDFMIATQPGDSLVREILRQAVENIEGKVANDVWRVTGPGIATRLLKQHGNQSALFEGYEFWPVKTVRKYVQFNWDLPYKSTDLHWVNSQKTAVIFR